MALATDRDARKYFAHHVESVFGKDADLCGTDTGTIYARKLFAPGKNIVFSYASGHGSFIITLNNAHLIVAQRQDAVTMCELSATLALLKSGDLAALKPNESAILTAAFVAKLQATVEQ